MSTTLLYIKPGSWQVTVPMGSPVASGFVNFYRSTCLVPNAFGTNNGTPNPYPRFQLVWNSASSSPSAAFTLYKKVEDPSGTVVSTQSTGFPFDTAGVTTFLIDVCSGAMNFTLPNGVSLGKIFDPELAQVVAMDGSPPPINPSFSRQPLCGGCPPDPCPPPPQPSCCFRKQIGCCKPTCCPVRSVGSFGSFNNYCCERKTYNGCGSCGRSNCDGRCYLLVRSETCYPPPCGYGRRSSCNRNDFCGYNECFLPSGMRDCRRGPGTILYSPCSDC